MRVRFCLEGEVARAKTADYLVLNLDFYVQLRACVLL